MNDRFKFRAWNKVMKYMDEGYSVQIDFNGSLWTGTHTANNFILMQSTGLKDKNRKLIFEGDIVEYDVPLECDKPLSRNVVEWSDSWSQWRLSRYSAPSYEGRRMTIIGNIHENQELLEASNE